VTAADDRAAVVTAWDACLAAVAAALAAHGDDDAHGLAVDVRMAAQDLTAAVAAVLDGQRRRERWGWAGAAAEPPAAEVLNDTHGDLTRAELAELRADAHPCLRCGMLADVDPVLHEARYGHAPKYRDESGRVFVWAGQWAELLDESAGGAP
jgi:hypothetical protein